MLIAKRFAKYNNYFLHFFQGSLTCRQIVILTDNYHRAFCFEHLVNKHHNVFFVITTFNLRHLIIYHLRQGYTLSTLSRTGQRDINMDWTEWGHCTSKCLVDQSVVKISIVTHSIGEIYRMSYIVVNSTILTHGLPYILVDVLLWAICRNNYKRHPLIICLNNSRSYIEQCRTRCDYNSRSLIIQSEAQGKESRWTLVGDGIAIKWSILKDIIHYDGISASRAQHNVMYAVFLEQSD